MGKEKKRSNGFDGAGWFERQVHLRTRAALNDQGIIASSHSREYKTEYARQLLLFRAERAEFKRRKHEKHLARMAKKTLAGHTCIQQKCGRVSR